MEERWNRLQIRRQLKEALGRKISLSNGGNLMIDQREAMSTVDVNSGSFVESDGGQNLPLSQNLAAVGEIARQIRLRNLSGMILIDFIDMDREDERRQVQEAMEQAAWRRSGQNRGSRLYSAGHSGDHPQAHRRNAAGNADTALPRLRRDGPHARRMVNERTYKNLEHHATYVTEAQREEQLKAIRAFREREDRPRKLLHRDLRLPDERP